VVAILGVSQTFLAVFVR